MADLEAEMARFEAEVAGVSGAAGPGLAHEVISALNQQGDDRLAPATELECPQGKYVPAQAGRFGAMLHPSVRPLQGVLLYSLR